MGEMTMGTSARPGLFLRNATGLVKAWSAYDAFVYSFMSVNLVTLGLYGMSFAYAIPQGQLLYAVLFTGGLVSYAFSMQLFRRYLHRARADRPIPR